jgi:hypothetical protein
MGAKFWLESQNKITRRSNRENSHLYISRRENLKSDMNS